MYSSPISSSAYEVLGVSPGVDTDELRRAYRRMLRETHPDTGGVAADFHAVQWAWEKVGTPIDRAAYDRGAGASRASASGSAEPQVDWSPSEGPNVRGTRPASTIYGDAGDWYRERYLQLLRDWKGTAIAKPYDPQLVRSAPPEVRSVLATAIAVEGSAQALDSLGIGYTIWHGIATATAAPGLPDETLDHIVLGASGLFALASRDWGGTVRTRKGELIGAVLAEDERPVHRLSVQARFVAKACSVQFTALVIVTPDGSSAESLEMLGSMRGTPTLLVWRSRLPHLMRTGLGTLPFRGGAEVFDIRTRLRAGIRFA